MKSVGDELFKKYVVEANRSGMKIKDIAKKLYDSGYRNSKGNLNPQDISEYIIRELGMRRIKLTSRKSNNAIFDKIYQVIDSNITTELKLKLIKTLITEEEKWMV